MEDKKFLLGLRHLSLSFVDLLERRLEIAPRTAEIRKWYKADHRNKPVSDEEKVVPVMEPIAAD